MDRQKGWKYLYQKKYKLPRIYFLCFLIIYVGTQLFHMRLAFPTFWFIRYCNYCIIKKTDWASKSVFPLYLKCNLLTFWILFPIYELVFYLKLNTIEESWYAMTILLAVFSVLFYFFTLKTKWQTNLNNLKNHPNLWG